ncbi:MAG: hypothetical protein MUE82_13605, partial [Chloroflexi bacterium]|nr:hypothetical protein [Chloroflexota bacterium]
MLNLVAGRWTRSPVLRRGRILAVTLLLLAGLVPVPGPVGPGPVLGGALPDLQLRRMDDTLMTDTGDDHYDLGVMGTVGQGE